MGTGEILLAISIVILCVYQLSKKKKLPPGPLALPVIGHFHLIGKSPHKDLYRLARKHGSIMHLRFGFVPIIVVSSPEAAKLVLKKHDLTFASRPPFKHFYGERSMVFGTYGPYWRDMRKLTTMELLSQCKIDQFCSMRMEELVLLVNGPLKQAARVREPVDLSIKISSLAADMTCLMVFGKKYADKDMDEKGFRAIFAETMEAAATFNIGDYFPYIGRLDLQGLTRRMKALTNIFDGFLDKIIDERIQNMKSHLQGDHAAPRDFIQTMMTIMESGEAEFEFNRHHVKVVLMDMLAEGMDTTTAAQEWTMSELLRHPKVMKKLQQELEKVVGMDHILDESHLERLQYLDCVVKETLRLHPVAPLLLPHESMEDCSLEGFHIPKKSRILVNVWAIGRDPNVWPNPEKFSPERFIDNNIDVRGRDFQLIPFGSGRRGCPGLNLGLLVVKLVVAQLVHCFDWELQNGTLPEDLDMSEHFGLVTSRTNHLMAIPTFRLNLNN